MVELGIQSFDDAALALAQRGYDGNTARRACAEVRAQGLSLGVQLLPGMPGVSPRTFVHDVATALEQGADLLRFYPCQVLEGTVLAALWRQGGFTPWPLDDTVDALAEGWLLAQRAGVPVVRMGLAPEPGLEEQVLAGPRHAALGALVQAEALCRSVEQAMSTAFPPAAPLSALEVPRFCQGFFWGDKGGLRPRWARLGITAQNLRWHAEAEVRLIF